MIPFSTLYDLSVSKQREDEQAARRYRLVREAERLLREHEAVSVPWRARIGRLLVRWGHQLAAGYPVRYVEDSRQGC